MSGEDFGFMLERSPGALTFIGQGPGPFVHSSHFNFNDDVSVLGSSFFARLR
jgi:hippurate hydrolase